MKKLMALIVAALMIAAICAIPAAATDRVEVAGYYEYSAEKNDEILAGEAGEATMKWNVPYLGIEPVLDGTIGKTEYVRFENYEDYITMACTTNFGAENADALYELVKGGFFDAYWGWDGKYLYMAFEVDCIAGYHCNFNDDVMLFAYNCLQIGLDAVDADGKTPNYTELGFGYDNVTNQDRSFTWAGTYQSQDEDFVGKYDDTTKRVTYELRIDLQLALNLDAYPENGDQCNFAFVLEIDGDDDSSKNAQVLFCQGIGGQYSGKQPLYFARITFEGKPNDVIVPPSEIEGIDPVKLEYDLREIASMSDSTIFASMAAEGGTIEQITEGEDTFLRFTMAEENGYLYSNTYPRNVLCDARYVVIKYRTNYANADEIGVLWKTRQDPEYRIEDCFYDYIIAADGWNYAVIDMNSEATWQDYIRGIGFIPFYDDAEAVGATFDLAFIEFYGEDPYSLYEDKMLSAPEASTEATTEDVTDAPAGDSTGATTQAPAGSEEVTTEAEKSGSCGGVVGAGVLAIVAVFGTAVVLKKKD
ncbi:MAG: hypothetical protein IJW70_11595 [Clostridia bacterium]|nr:hypothetical protein [Clostridia bacterium]